MDFQSSLQTLFFSEPSQTLSNRLWLIAILNRVFILAQNGQRLEWAVLSRLCR